MSTSRPIGMAAPGGDARAEELAVKLGAEYGAHLAIMDRRLEEALTAAGFDGAVVFAGDEQMVFRDDQPYPFSAEPYFKAWVPLTQAPGSFVRLVPGQRPMLVYKQVEDFWFEPPEDPSGYWTQHFDIRIARSDAEARKLSGSGPRWVAVGEPASIPAASTPQTQPAVNDAKFLSHLDYYRAVKTPYELLCMRAAQAIAVRGHLAVAAAFGPGVSELELHNAYCKATEQRESQLPYGSIVALNEHGATLHYQHLRARAPAVGRSLLIDAGAQHLGYAADITRTWAAATDDFGTIIASVEALQQQVCREVKAGADFVALHKLAHRLLGGVLREHGLVRCSAEEADALGITRAFLPHGLGHLLGLQVHDAGGRQVSPDGARREPPAEDPFLRLTRVLEAGFVVTIEPGMYFIPALLKSLLTKHEDKVNRAKIERLLPFGGIRIEDDIEVTADGSKNLTREAFSALGGQARSRERH
ncbi:MAG TPA: Xaa-Pro dipeptidase [Gammaproteobacteria bacterium]|nr:Xaa-Pro dipeptidase [Gammaproteobacteria bacterium]